MNFSTELIGDYPQLGWVALVSKDCSAAHLSHGSGVAVGDRFFFEGAWAGQFEEGRPDRTEVVFGSGAVLHEEGMTVVPSLATCDSIHWTMIGDGSRLISNSLVLLLARTGRRLDPKFGRYDQINESILRGIDQYDNCLPTTGEPVHRLIHHNLRIAARSEDSLLCKAKPPRFISYADYHNYLDGSVLSLLANAKDPQRRSPLKVFTTQSRGYDTTAVNTIAKDWVDLAFTVRQAKIVGVHAGKERRIPESDDGTEIASALGIPVVGIDRLAFRDAPEWEVFYRAGIHKCQDLNLVGIHPLVSGPALLLTGILGQIWYPESTMGRFGDDLRAVDQGGSGLGEVRLHLGLTQAAIPFIGARRYSDILKITESAEMDPWRIGGLYDRPIPRRIAEEAGVPRELFGQKKLASVVEGPNPEFPFGSELRQRYLQWLMASGIRGGTALRLFRCVQWYNSLIGRRSFPQYRWLYFSERVISKIARRDWKLPSLWRDLFGMLYVFAVNTLADEHEAAEANAAETRSSLLR